MKKRTTGTLIAMTFAVANVLAAGPISEVAERLVTESPAVAFSKAVAKKDFRLLTIPFCGGITPGFDFSRYRGERLDENDLGLSCYSLLGEEELDALTKLEAWVKEYNSLMFSKLNESEQLF